MSRERFFGENIEQKEALPFSGKTALVTGAGRDIGAAISTELVKNGAYVYGNYRGDPKRILRLSNTINGTGGSFSIIPADITNESDRERMFGAITYKTFDPKLDILVLNAAARNTEENQDYARKVNLEATNALVDQYLPIMQKGGKIIYIQSVPGNRFDTYDPSLLPDEYLDVARYKQEAQRSLEAKMPEFDEKGVSLAIVSPPIVSDTINIKFFKRKARGFEAVHMRLVDELNEEKGLKIPHEVTTSDVGRKVSELIMNGFPQGYTEYFSS